MIPKNITCTLPAECKNSGGSWCKDCRYGYVDYSYDENPEETLRDLDFYKDNTASTYLQRLEWYIVKSWDQYQEYQRWYKKDTGKEHQWLK